MLDISPILQPIVVATGAVITGIASIYVPKFIKAFQDRTGIILTENQRQTVLDAVNTAAGILETAMDQGVLKVEHINIGNPNVTDQAQKVINAVPAAASALGLQKDDVVRMIIGAVDTTSRKPAV